MRRISNKHLIVSYIIHTYKSDDYLLCIYSSHFSLLCLLNNNLQSTVGSSTVLVSSTESRTPIITTLLVLIDTFALFTLSLSLVSKAL